MVEAASASASPHTGIEAQLFILLNLGLRLIWYLYPPSLLDHLTVILVELETN
jgi:hypothetical protein